MMFLINNFSCAIINISLRHFVGRHAERQPAKHEQREEGRQLHSVFQHMLTGQSVGSPALCTRISICEFMHIDGPTPFIAIHYAARNERYHCHLARSEKPLFRERLWPWLWPQLW